MIFDAIEQLFLSDPHTTLKTGLRFTHFIGLALGLGGATLLDLMMLRYCFKGCIQKETFSMFEFSTRIVSIGLRILWITGIGFLLFYAVFDVAKLYNPKVHAKLVIVAILSVNGVFIHNVILPTLRAQVGKGLFEDVGPVKRSLFITSGAISAVSWYVPVALGAFSQLNNAVPATMILSVYLALIVLAAVAMNLALSVIHASVGQTCRKEGAQDLRTLAAGYDNVVYDRILYPSRVS